MPMSRAEFVAYATAQIAAAEEIAARHQQRGSMCTCGRTHPCSQAESADRTLEHFRGQLALAEQTVLLPALKPAAGPTSPGPASKAPATRWRWVADAAAAVLGK